MQVGAAVIKRREEECIGRHAHYPVADTVFNTVIDSVIAEPRLRHGYRTDAAENVLIDLIGSVKHFHAVSRLARDIIYRMDQQDQIMFAKIIEFNDLIIEFFQQNIIL